MGGWGVGYLFFRFLNIIIMGIRIFIFINNLYYDYKF